MSISSPHAAQPPTADDTHRPQRTAGVRRLIDRARGGGELVLPLFVREDLLGEEPAGIPGVSRYGVPALVRAVAEARDDGVSAFLLFGVPARKGIEHATRGDNVVSQAIRALRDAFGDSVTLLSDIGFSAYLDHGQSTILHDGRVDVAETMARAGDMARAHAAAGVDLVAPCMSLPEQVPALLAALREEHPRVGLMAYSAKFASSFYGPFRSTVGSPLRFGGKEAYQHSLLDGEGAVARMVADEAAGADLVMVKPALCYLDVVQAARDRVTAPIAVYNVSGEMAMLQDAVAAGHIGEDEAWRELASAFQRAGARVVISYAARRLSRMKGR